MILPVVLYGCETSSSTLNEEYTFKVFGDRVLRRGFGPGKDLRWEMGDEKIT
jgi:hypothetical protein